MQEISPLSAPTTVIIGTRGFPGSHGPFGSEENDGVVAASEVSADEIADEIRVPVVHTLLPSSRLVTAVILRRLAQDRAAESAIGRAD
ncbi:hypothetical protein [Dechloromonas sp. A34]|uniref:hypothetical protein n=1 Tax=Dechloromonas sp. A34 TaxID=447588 RepID=UPI00224963AC|nr:hypothetical protein [Dechloromonas sp. A34]